MKALLKPLKKKHSTETVELIARTSGGLVTVRLGNSRIFAVDGWRLCDPTDWTRRITATELAELPWNGKGDDPLAAKTRLKPSSPTLVGEVSPPCGDGGVESPSHAAHDPSVGDYADTSPASPGRSA